MNKALFVQVLAVTLQATFAPGPTTSLLAKSAATKNMCAPRSALAGVTVANALCALTVWLVWTIAAATRAEFLVFLKFGGVFFLTYFGTKLLAPAAVELIYSAGGYETSEDDPPSFFRAAIGIHYTNSILFYGPLFAQFFDRTWTSNLLLVLVPTAVDFVSYVFLLRFVRKHTHLPAVWQKPKWRAALELGLTAMIACVLVKTSRDLIDSNSDHRLWVILVVLLGLLSGALMGGYRLVRTRANLINKRAWRLVSTWGSYFTVSTVVTTIIGLQSHASSRFLLSVRIVAAFCAVTSGTLTFVKAVGELQDELSPLSAAAVAPQGSAPGASGDERSLATRQRKYEAPWIGSMVFSIVLSLFFLVRWIANP